MTDVIAQYRADAERIKAKRDKLKAELNKAIAQGSESGAHGLRKRIRDLDSLHYNLMLAVKEMEESHEP